MSSSAAAASQQYVDTGAHISSREQYEAMYSRSIADPAGFWRDIAVANFHWHTEPDVDHHAHNFDISKGPIFSEWFRGGRTNICYNCLDRHVAAGGRAGAWSGAGAGCILAVSLPVCIISKASALGLLSPLECIPSGAAFECAVLYCTTPAAAAAAGHGDQACFLFEGNDPGRDAVWTYAQVLKARRGGVNAGSWWSREEGRGVVDSGFSSDVMLRP